MRRIVFFWFMLSLVYSCQTDVVFNSYEKIENNAWRQENTILFEIKMQDTIQSYHVFLNLRNNKDYAYRNLFLITQMTFPDQTRVVDTLEYEMSDADGNFLGSGFSDIKENKLFYKENIRFPQSGTYHLEVKQAMRKRNKIAAISPLKGVSDVGVSIEKAK